MQVDIIQTNQVYSSYKFLHYLLLLLIIGLVISELALKQYQIMDLVIICVIYLLLIWHRVSTLIYKLVIIFCLALLLQKSLQLLYFCFGEGSQNKWTTPNDQTITGSKYRNYIIVTSIWMFIMVYSTVLSWRAHQRSRLYISIAAEYTVV